MAQNSEREIGVVVSVCAPESACGDKDQTATPNISPSCNETTYPAQIEIVDLYAVQREPQTLGSDDCDPFVHEVGFEGPHGELVRVRSLFDEGAMVAAMDAGLFERVKHRLSGWGPSRRCLRMADGTRVQPKACWKGRIRLGRMLVMGEFEVFDSGGGWSFLFSKPLLRQFKAIHDYEDDTIQIRQLGESETLSNQWKDLSYAKLCDEVSIGVVLDWKQRRALSGGNYVSPARRVHDAPNPHSVEHDNQLLCPSKMLDIQAHPHMLLAKASPTDEIKRRAWRRQKRERQRRSRRRLTFYEELALAVGQNSRAPADQRASCSVEEVADEGDVLSQDRWSQREPPSGRSSQDANTRTTHSTAGHSQRQGRARMVVGRRWKNRAFSEGQTRTRFGGSSSALPAREVPPHLETHIQSPSVDTLIHKVTESPEYPICVVTEDAEVDDLGVEIPTDGLGSNTSIFTRRTDPFNPARVAAVQAAVTLGPDLTPDERDDILGLIANYADCFALSVGEVFHVPGAVHRLNIPQGTTFGRKVHQRPLTPPQRAYLNESIDKMLEAGVIEQVDPSDVKCVSPTTLAQKVHQGRGLSLNQLQHQLNDECVRAGLPPAFNLPPRSSEPVDRVPSTHAAPAHWSRLPSASRMSRYA